MTNEMRSEGIIRKLSELNALIAEKSFDQRKAQELLQSSMIERVLLFLRKSLSKYEKTLMIEEKRAIRRINSIAKIIRDDSDDPKVISYLNLIRDFKEDADVPEIFMNRILITVALKYQYCSAEVIRNPLLSLTSEFMHEPNIEEWVKKHIFSEYDMVEKKCLRMKKDLSIVELCRDPKFCLRGTDNSSDLKNRLRVALFNVTDVIATGDFFSFLPIEKIEFKYVAKGKKGAKKCEGVLYIWVNDRGPLLIKGRRAKTFYLVLQDAIKSDYCGEGLGLDELGLEDKQDKRRRKYDTSKDIDPVNRRIFERFTDFGLKKLFVSEDEGNTIGVQPEFIPFLKERL